MKKHIRAMVLSVLRLLPTGMPERIYVAFLRGPMRLVLGPLLKLLIPAEATIPEGVVVLNKKDIAVSVAVSFGMYEPYESQLFRETIKAGMTAIDIGANIGYYSTIMAACVGPSGRLLSFEPEPENFAILKQTLERNAFSHAEAFQLAIADKSGMLKLNIHDANKGKHSLVKDNSVGPGFSSSVEVSTVTLDDFLQGKGITHVDVIKVDIEGAESLALKGMPLTLKNARVLFLEFTPSSIMKAGDDPAEVLRLLRVKGFSIFNISEKNKSKSLVEDDKLFIQKIPDSECANLICLK